MLIKSLVVLGMALVVVLIYASRQPVHYEFTKEIECNAEGYKIYALLENTAKVNLWMPRNESELKMEVSYATPFSTKQTARLSIHTTDINLTLMMWTVSGESNFLGQIARVFFSADKVTGQEFEKSLNRLKELLEKET